MQLPAFTHGLTREVKRRTSRIITRLARGRSWDEAVAEVNDGELLDTDDIEGLIVLDGPSPLLGSEPHFHLYMPLMMTLDAMVLRRKRLPLDRQEEFFAAFLQHDWSILALQGRGNQLWTYPEHRFAPFLSASLQAWPGFPDEPRYTIGIDNGSLLWDCAPMVCPALASLGVPNNALQPMIRTREQLMALMEAHDIRLDPAPSP